MDPTELSQLTAGLNQTGGAAQQLAEAFAQAARAAGNNATAASDAAKASRQSSAASADAASSLMGVGRTATGVINSFTSVGASVYGAEKAFDSLIPIVESLTQNTASSLRLMGQLAGLLPGVGKAGEVAGELASGGLEVLSSALKFNISAAQKVTDNFLELSRVGATFGGSMSEMAIVARGIGIPLQDLTRIITANAESIGNLGMGMSKGGSLVAGMSKRIFDTNAGLVGLYGNVQNLSKGTSEYLEMQTQLGVNAERDAEKLEAGAIEYLMRQKELSAITGKNAETLKKEEQSRRNQLDYNLKLGRLGKDAQENVREGLAMSGKIFGDAGAKYAEEYFATGGKVYSQEALRYQAMNQEAADAIAQFVTGVDTDTKSYRDNNSKYLKENAASLEGFARSQEEMAEINRGANNPIIRSQTETASAILQNLTLIKTSTDLFAQLAKDREKTEGGAKTPDELTSVMVDAERKRSVLQREIDVITLDNMKKLGTVVDLFNSIALAQIKAQGAISDVALKFANIVSDPLTAIKENAQAIADILAKARENLNLARPQAPAGLDTSAYDQNRPWYDRQPTAPATPATPAPATPNPETPNVPQREDGGITSGKTIAGENGAEAIIPLKNGTIPLKVDLTQLVQAMAEQTQLTKDVIRELQDNNDLTKKLIDYTT